jgi:hypothetical protein
MKQGPSKATQKTIDLGNNMTRKKQAIAKAFVLFDVIYEDGTRSSNRKIAAADLDALDATASARAIIEAQDREIAVFSGKPRGSIKSIARSDLR